MWKTPFGLKTVFSLFCHKALRKARQKEVDAPRENDYTENALLLPCGSRQSPIPHKSHTMEK
jgi:hypothetical protein